jgi:hypothetical protein
VDAVLSGHAGVALLLDGDKLSSLHFEDSDEALPRSPGEVHLLFAGAQDLEFLENVGLEEVRGHLDLAGTRVDALHLALNLLDSELSHETRRCTAEDLEELLADDRIGRWVESVLFAHPLPRSADPVGARSACTGRTERTRELLGKLESLQPVIVEVQQAWEAIPARLFATDEDRKHAISVAVKEGLFRDLVVKRAAGERVDDFLLKSLMNPMVRQIGNAPRVLVEWVADFSEPRKAPPPLEHEISYVAEDTEWEREEQGWRGVPEYLIARIDQAETYRRRSSQDTWHFCSNCSQWPLSDFDEKSTKPTAGEFCNECQSKRAKGACR